MDKDPNKEMNKNSFDYLEKYGTNPRELRVALGQHLREYGVTPSRKNVVVFEYLLKSSAHSTADEIFHALNSTMLDISRTQVYTILEVFSNVGIVNVLKTDQGETYYDAITTPHAHFICAKCSSVMNLGISADLENEVSTLLEMPKGIELHEINLVCSGLCAECKAEEDRERFNRS